MNTKPLSHAVSDSRRGILLFAAGLIAMLLLTFLVYRPGLDGSFLLDDMVNLQQLGNDGGVSDGQSALNYIFGNRSGPAGRPVSMASFLLDGQDWPTPPARFKYTNLMIHLLCGLLVSWFCLLVLRAVAVREKAARLMALLVAALWLLHPLNVSTTLYIVQRMTQLMTLFSLAALVFYLKGRCRVGDQPIKGLLLMSLGLFPFGVLAVLSKENGALLLVAILVLESTIFSTVERSRWHRLWLLTGILMPLLVVVVYIVFNFGSLTANYQFREFSLGQRLLTEGRILLDYLFNIFIPRIGEFSLYRDGYRISRGLFDPFSTFLSLLAMAGLLIAAVKLRKQHPLLGFAVLWFFGWHLLESTFLPLELYFEHRNYVAMIGPLLAAIYYLDLLIQRLLKSAGNGNGKARAGAVLILLPAIALTFQLTSLWSNSIALQAHWAERHPASYRAQIEYAYLLARFDEHARGYQRIASINELYPEELVVQMQLWNYACTYGLPAPFAITELANSEQQVYYRADLTGELKLFLENLFAGRCDYPNQQEIVALLERLSRVPMRTFERSGFHLLFSDLFVYYRQLNPALMQLRAAFDVRPDAQYPIRQAVIAASAGNFEDSLVFLERARVADDNRRPFVASRLEEIETMERDLKSRLGID